MKQLISDDSRFCRVLVFFPFYFFIIKKRYNICGKFDCVNICVGYKICKVQSQQYTKFQDIKPKQFKCTSY